MLLAELASVERQRQSGTLPASTAERLAAELEAEMRGLRRRRIAKLKTDAAELLRAVPFLRDLPPEDFSVLAARLRPQTIAAGETIFRQGDAGEALYIIARGVVRISRRESDDWRHLATLMAGDFFGEGALLDRRPRRATVTAVTPCALYKLRRSDLELLTDVYPNIRRTLEREDRRRKLANGDQAGVPRVVAHERS